MRVCDAGKVEKGWGLGWSLMEMIFHYSTPPLHLCVNQCFSVLVCMYSIFFVLLVSIYINVLRVYFGERVKNVIEWVRGTWDRG